ncbi:MAG TPA: hypothetical protein VFJ43_18415 [Bacteroidia bacterium]|nr:hypothetical protein [Bacteroidia bacterium]
MKPIHPFVLAVIIICAWASPLLAAIFFKNVYILFFWILSAMVMDLITDKK